MLIQKAASMAVALFLLSSFLCGSAVAFSSVTPVTTSPTAASPLIDFDYETQDRLPYFSSGYETWQWKRSSSDGQEFPINYIELGDPSKPTLLLIHGFGASAYHFRFNLPVLARDYHVLAMDMLGFGWSEKPISVNYTADLWKDQVAEFLEAKVPADKPVVLCGNSLGGYTALLSSVRLGLERVQGCILLNAAGTFSDPEAEIEASAAAEETTPGWIQSIQTWIQRTVIQLSFVYTKQPARIEQVLRNVYPIDDSNVDQDLVDSIQLPSFHPNAAEVFYRVISKSGSKPEFVDDLVKQLECPLLLCWGESDPWIRPAAADKIMAVSDRARRVSIDAGHCPHDENPKQVNSAILDFMSEVAAA